MSGAAATKNGSTIRSWASLQILVGDGSVAPARLHSSCQTSNATAMTRRRHDAFATLPSTVAGPRRQRRRFGGSATTVAVAAGVTVAGSAFSNGMFMTWVSRSESPASGRSADFGRLIVRLLR